VRQREQAGNLWKSRGWWYLRFRQNELQPDGTTKRTQKTERLAEAKGVTRSKESKVLRDLMRERMDKINGSASKPEPVLTIAQFVERHYLPHVKEQLRPMTYRTVNSRWTNHLKEHAGHYLLRDFTTVDAIAVLRDIAKRGPELPQLHRSYLRQLKTVLSAIFKLARQLGIIDHDPIRDASIPQGVKSVPRGAYDFDQVRKMLESLPYPERAIVAVAALAGLRQGEIQGLQWEDYDGHSIQVRRNCVFGQFGEPKTKDSAAPVPVTPLLAQILEEYRRKENNRTSGLMFHRDDGEWLSLQKVAERMRPVLKKAGLPWYGWHGFRRGAASSLFALGVQGKTIQQVLRHSDLQTTMKYYVRSTEAAAAEALAGLDAKYQPATQTVQ
jgi:integrase